MNKNENAYMILCICEKFKQVYFFIILLLGMRAVWTFYRSQFFGGNRCNEPLSYVFFVKRQSSVAVFFVCKGRITMEKIKGDIYGRKRIW